MEPNNENSVGPVIAIIIVLAMIVLGGLYFWNERSKMNSINDSLPQSTADEVAASIEKQSTSDDTGAIESDLNNTQVDNVDQELQSL